MSKSSVVLTGGPAFCGFGLLQLNQGPHHGRQGAGSFPPTRLPLTGALVLVFGLSQSLLALRRGRTPADQELSNSFTLIMENH